ncbi:MAG: spore germination protein [Clostridia bacterium]|nr:spore germination protein [Clostridia bacterium]
MKNLTTSLNENIELIKTELPAEDILVYSFTSADKSLRFAIVYADGVVDKALLGDLAARPLKRLTAPEKGKLALNDIKEALLFPELKEQTETEELKKEILDGNAVLLTDGLKEAVIVGAKLPPSRAVIEPPTDVAVKGPREGFVEDIKINMALLRKRLKTPQLLFEMQKVGKQSETNVAVCYLKGIADEEAKDAIVEKLKKIDTDVIVDSSYIATFLAPRKRSVFRQSGTTEKPDILAAKMAEGRIGILVDGSPIALTTPYLLTEDFQSSEDYFVSPFWATITRVMRVIAVLVAILLPAFYVSSQLFKLQLLPLSLTLTIASSIQGLPLSPSLEMFLVLFVLEVLKEASVRMPKYVGMALSVVGALVLGETAVSAGFVSTPAIIIVAFSGICLYTVPNFTETGSILRWLFLIVAGSIGPFGIVLTAAFVLYYLISSDAFGVPMLAPFAPLVKEDLKDSLVKFNMERLDKRPTLFKPKNRTRLQSKDGKKTKKGETENGSK